MFCGVTVRIICLSWNQKFLDYEIETKRGVEGSQPTTHSWNQKFLDYEIETLFLA